jgi:hypothetical protein
MRPETGGRIDPAAVPPPSIDPEPGAAEPASPDRSLRRTPTPSPVLLPNPFSPHLDSRGVLIFAVAVLLAALAGLAYVIAE